MKTPEQGSQDENSEKKPETKLITIDGLKSPFETSSIEEDGSTKTTTQQEDGSITWVKTYPDGKTVTLDAIGYEVTRYKEGNLEYTAKNGMHVEIKVGYGDDVIQARRMLQGKSDEDAFMRTMISQLCRFDGKFIPPEELPKKFKAMDYIFLLSYYQEVNF